VELLGATRAATLSVMVPVSAILLAALALGEPLGGARLAGAAPDERRRRVPGPCPAGRRPRRAAGAGRRTGGRARRRDGRNAASHVPSRMTPRVCLATSVPPVLRREIAPGIDIGPRYQRLCIESWAATGWRVLSVNIPEEAAALRAMHPRLALAEAPRSARAVFGRPFVWIEDLFAALEAQDAEVAGIVNSDIWLALAPAERDAAAARARDGLVVYNRAEIAHLAQRSGPLYRYGFDLFLWPRDLPRRLDMRGLALGVPWWDYWIILNALLLDVPVWLVQNPSARHLTHAQNWDPRHWETAVRSVVRRIGEFRRAAAADRAASGQRGGLDVFVDAVMDQLVGSIRFDQNAAFLGAQLNHGIGTMLGLDMVRVIERHAHRLA